jgi:mannose-6-phosphate isomerase
LYEKDPSNFTDPNHKPEIALALGDFEAFCGFKPLNQIHSLLKLEPLKQSLPDANSSKFDQSTLKEVLKAMLKAPPEVIKELNRALQKLPKDSFGSDTYIPDLIPRLAEQYDEGDNGTIVALITMNYLRLKAGDSIYIPADGIHAYLSGDIIECMARSNNVLNTGFCPRADRNSVDMFCDVLTFSPNDANSALLPSKSFDRSKNGKTKLYAPPLSEFDMLATELDKGEKEGIGALKGPSIMIVTEGSGKLKAEGKEFKLSQGYIFFIGQGVDLEFEAESKIKAFTAFVE